MASSYKFCAMLVAVPLLTLVLTQNDARAQPAANTPAASGPAPYCTDLKHIANLAMTRERFSSIIGKPRQGNFRDTSRPLTGWKDCAFYGNNAYTCDSHGFASEDAA